MTAPAPRHAVIVGATGAVGSALLAELLASPRWGVVTVLGRRAPDALLATLPAAHRARVHAHLVPMDDSLEAATADALRADRAPAGAAAFCTLGVGQPRKLPREEVWRVDVDVAGAFARGCRAAGVDHLSLLSSVGADAASRSYYLRVKGSAEAAVSAPGFARVSLFRPSLLVTRTLRYGLQDRVTQWAVPKLAPLLPSRFHPVRVEALARAMRLNAERAPTARVDTLEYADFVRLLAAAR